MKIKHTTTQAQLVEKFFTYYGCKLEMITAIDSDNSIMFIIITNDFSFVNLVPKYKPDEINIFYNNVRIKFNKTVENGK
jgi:adenylate kinase family enzyme